MIIERDEIERELVGGDFLADRLGERAGNALVVERGSASPFRGVDRDELAGSRGEVVTVPEAGIAVEPVGGDLVLENQSRRSPRSAPGLRRLRRKPRVAWRRLEGRGPEWGGQIVMRMPSS